MRLSLGLPADTCPHGGDRMSLRALVRHQNLWTEPLGLAVGLPS